MPVSLSFEQLEAHREGSVLPIASLGSSLGSKTSSSGGCRL